MGGTLHNLAFVLASQGKPAEARKLLEPAIHHQRIALEGNPDHPAYQQFLCNHWTLLVETLASLGKHDDAARAAEEMLQECKTLAKQDARLRRVLKGETDAADVGERLALAEFCQKPFKSLYAAAVRFYANAFAEQPGLADDLQKQHRYNAACAAALAGCGQGKVADQSDDTGRARLRQQALEWLRADLKAYRQTLDQSAGKIAGTVAQRMQHWLRDKDFNGVRRAEALAKLPEAERGDWQRLWEEVASLREQAAKQEAEGRLVELFDATRKKDETRLQDSLTEAKTEAVHEVKLTAGQAVVIEMHSK